MKIHKVFNSQNIKISAVGSLGIKFFSALFAFLSGILLARALGLQNYGIYVLAFTTITLLSVPTSLGLPNLITRYISKYQVQENYSAIKGILIRCNQFTLISYAIILICAAISYFFWWKNFGTNLCNTTWIGFILLLFMALGSIKAAALRGLHFVILGQLPDTLLRNFLLCVGIGIYFVFKIKLSPFTAMLIYSISALLSYLVAHFFLQKKLLNNLKEVKPEYHNREWFMQSIPFSVNSGVQIVRSKLVTYVLVAFGSVKGVAIYDIALRGASLVSFTLDALNTAIAPYISAAFEKNNIKTLQKIVTKTSRLIFAFAFPVVAVFIIGGHKFISILFGQEFTQSYVPLIIACIGQLISSICGSVGLVLIMTGNQKYFTNNNIIITILNVIICIPFVIYFDVIGATFVYSFLLILQNIILFIHVKSKLHINTTIF